MATVAITTDLSTNLLTACDSLTADGTWTGVILGVGTSDPLPLEGTGRLDGIFKSTTDTSNDSFFAPTGGVVLTNEHIRWPLFTALKAVLDPSGIDLILGDGTNTAYYTVSGADKYIGGWESLVLDVNATPASGTAPNMAAITFIGIIFRLAVAAKNVDTAWFDYITFGDGFQSISGGTSGDEIALSHIDTFDVYYKIFEKIAGIYRCRGELVFGSSGTATTYFKDPGQVIMFDDLVVSDTLYKIKGIGNATGDTHLDYSGIFISAETVKYLVDFTDANLTSVTLDGTTFQNANNVNLSDTVSGISTIFDACDAVDANEAPLSSVVIKNTTESTTGSLELNTLLSVSSCVNMFFNDYTSKYAIYIPAAITDDISFDNFQFDGSGTDVYWAGTAGTLNISLANGSNASTSSTAGGTVNFISGQVTLKVIVVDDITGLPLTDARVWVGKESDKTELLNGECDVNGEVSVSLTYSSDLPFVGWARELSQTGTDYVQKNISGTITSTGATVSVRLQPID